MCDQLFFYHCICLQKFNFSLLHTHFFSFSFMLYTFRAQGMCSYSLKHESNSLDPFWSTIGVLGLGGLWDRFCYWHWVKSNCAIIAAVQVKKESSHFKNSRRFPEDVFADSLLFCRPTFIPSFFFCNMMVTVSKWKRHIFFQKKVNISLPLKWFIFCGAAL